MSETICLTISICNFQYIEITLHVRASALMENLLLKERLTPRGYEGLIGVINPNDAMERCDKMSLAWFIKLSDNLRVSRCIETFRTALTCRISSINNGVNGALRQTN